MHFVWPAQRYDRLTGGPAALATVLTLIACVSIALPLVSAFRAPRSSASSTERSPERVTFLQPIRRVAGARRVVGVSRPTPRVARVEPDRGSVATDTSSLSPVQARPTPATDTSSASASDAPTPATRVIGPVIAPSAFSKVIIPQSAKDSIDKRMAAYYLKLYQTFQLTPEQKDSAGREQGRRAVAARDDHRPLAIPLGSIPLRMPFGGSVRSREQRLKDDSVHADNLQRLARLEERARAKRDSMLRATIAAKRDADDRRDSLMRLGRPRP